MNSPEELTRYNPPSLASFDTKTLLPSPLIVAELIRGRPSPIEFSILSEVSNKIKILAGTSPDPDPGGNGFAFVN